jgi:hypothetical protein
MSAYLPVKLMIGWLVFNITWIVTPTLNAAQVISTKSTTKASAITEVENPKLSFSIAQAATRTRRIRFQRGTSSAVVEDAVVRGTRDIYLLGAKAGQNMTVSITSLENNAVFDIITPNQKILKQEAMSWSTKLPANGDYRIVVGGTRGNATYKLRVEIK